MKVEFRWRQYKYLPYERILASRELTTLTGQPPEAAKDGLLVDIDRDWKAIARRTTYFQEAVPENGERIIPSQTLLEASANGEIGIQNPTPETYVPPRRQSTRYSAHGIHEYRGKFNPQIVRAVGNLIHLELGAWVLDPFCGSGTTLLEAAHVGWNAVGVDLNPLGVEIARAKIAALRIDLDQLRRDAHNLEQTLQSRFAGVSFAGPLSDSDISAIGGPDWQASIPCMEYLRRWFAPSVLIQLSAILDGIEEIPDSDVRLILRVILSDIVRDVSLQDEGDLRIRRQKSPEENMPAVPLFLESVFRRIDLIARARQVLGRINTVQYATVGDSRFLANAIHGNRAIPKHDGFDAAITSPPYATALPYIDTQRLSLVLFGLITDKAISQMQKELIGTREIGDHDRETMESAIETNSAALPADCAAFCAELADAVDERRDGFRRRNVPSLVYKYLRDMAMVFRQTSLLLKSRALLALLVGPNRTSLGGHSVLIDTPRLLRSLAEANGFETREILRLNTYQRYDIHRANSIRAEDLMLLRRAKHAN